MSKKILKRSLALGALMAFVITGSAMAAAEDKVKLGVDELSTVLQAGSKYKEENGTYVVEGAIFRHKGNGNNKAVVDLNSKKLIINKTDGFGYGNAPLYGYFEIIDKSDTTKGILEVVGGVICSDDSVINVGEFKVTTASGNSIESYSTSTASTIDANKIEVNATTNAFMLYGNLDIGSNDKPVGQIDIQAYENGTYSRPIRVSGATANVYANTLNISGATKSSKVTGGGTLKLVVNKDGEITNDFEAGENGTSKGIVNLTLGTGVNWTGKMVTDNASVGALDLSGTWNLTGASSLTEATFNAGSKLVIDGATYEYNDAANATNVYALNGVGDAKLKVEDNAQIQVTNIKNATYNIATGFKTIEANNYWDVLDLTNVMQATWDKAENNDLKLVISAKGADAMEDSVAPEGSGEMVSEIITEIGNVENISELPKETQAAAKFIQDAVVGNDDVTAKNIISNALQMAEAGGNSGTAVTVANNVSSVTTGRMGFSATPSAQKGGNGVGLLAEDSGAAIWAQYVHGKDSVEDMPMSGGATSYEGQFNGVVMGVDFKKVGKFQSGVAFNYGEGDTNSVGNRISTHSDYDFWGVGYYGNIRNDDTNFIFDVNYAKSESDVEQDNGVTTLEASPETTTWSAGVKVEKLYQNNNVQIVPYTGLRFMSVDTDSYKATNGTDTLFNYAPERQDIWLLPLGVSIKQEVTNANGWTVTPKVDLSYIWAFGDTDSEMTVAIPGVSSTSRLGYTVMDDESWLGVVGLEAAKGDWTFGVSYSYQKGDHSENEKWYVDAKYSF